ncbi:hypothetical protein A2U01_0019730, partial [Trifolium medium]|nr:hypothetical protein [Trifolium medium]
VVKDHEKLISNSGGASRKLPSLKGVSTVFLSDDDNNDVVKNKPPTFMKGSGSGSRKGTKRVEAEEDDPIGDLTFGDFVRRSDLKEAEEPCNISKKLGFTPSPKNNFKRSKAVGPQTKQPSFSPSYVNYAGSGSNTFRTTPNVGKVPKNFKCKFRPHNKMKVSKVEATICAYVFADTNATNAPPTHHSDLLFNMDTYFAFRSDFDCLVPGGVIGSSVSIL